MPTWPTMTPRRDSPDADGAAAGTSHADRLADWFRRFAEVECPDLPLYRALCLIVAEHPGLLSVVLDARPGQWRPNILLAAVHLLVRRNPDAPLAAYFPTASSTPRPPDDALASALAEFIERHADEIAELVSTRSTQTNEVNRSCLWFVAWHEEQRAANAQLAVIEVGASAGLNLMVERYSYDFGDGLLRGDRASSVRLGCALSGVRDLPADAPQPVWRLGIDREPIDLADADKRDWLQACIWPEQPERHARYVAAAASALEATPPVIRGDAVGSISAAAAAAPDDAHLVIVTSWVLTYLRRDDRVALRAALDAIGERRDLTWLSAEGAGVVPGLRTVDAWRNDTLVHRVRWRGGHVDEQLVARCHPHLRWLEWLDGSPPA